MPEGQQLLRCQPGLCVKTNINFKSGQKQKCFINIVHTDRLEDLTLIPAEQGSGHQVHLPYSLSPPRPDRDLKDEYCMTCDFAVSTGTFQRAAQSSQILKLLIDTAADGLSQQFLKGHEEVSKDYKVMQRLQCKGGQPLPMSVRAELLRDKGTKSQAPQKIPDRDAITPSELKEMRQAAKNRKKMSGVPDAAEDEVDESSARERKAKEPTPGRIRVPHHRLIHSGHLDLSDFMEVSGRPNPNTVASIPRHLRLVVELPTVKKSSDIKMEVTSNNVVLEVDGKFYLDMPLPYEVQEANGSAKFDKAKQTLTLELPVVPKMPDPEALAAAQRLQGLGSPAGDDGEVSDHEEEEPELPPLEEPEPQDKPAKEETSPVAEVEETPAVPEKVEPKRPLLELDGPGGALRLATAAEAEEKVGDMSHSVEELEDPNEEDAEELPPFMAAEAFGGAKAGYFFGTGDAGLGYYRDLRQRARRRQEPTPAPTLRSEGPLVEEVPEPAARELPSYAQRHVQETNLLSTRLPVSDAEVVNEEPPVIARLGRQNLLLRLQLPDEEPEAADLRLSLVGRRLTLSFCSRRPPLDEEGQGGSTSSGWRRRRLRRNLGGAVDLAQSCAEIVVTGRPPKRELQVVLRRASKNEAWDSAFAAASAPAEAARSEEAEAQALGLAAAPAGPPEALRPAEPSPAEAEAEAAEAPPDSAELDVAEPTVQDSTQAPAPRVQATAGAVQSAMVMGQSVLLQNRLMYQLL
ncbi:unnamed protein product [Symbiodinium natans]|uniref:PIH1 domain-containing protein 1 n=1 Tax=Symbiodinium natans TaxID=878477 RepID=A0A812J7L4_9DINO|nr:unnamed protein product [Symbiodinium natans]